VNTSSLLIPIVSTATETLSWAELTALNDAVQTGRDPHAISGYAQLSDLFTEDGGRRKHRETRIALAAVTLSRLMQS
jgi:hypothetical protein